MNNPYLNISHLAIDLLNEALLHQTLPNKISEIDRLSDNIELKDNEDLVRPLVMYYEAVSLISSQKINYQNTDLFSDTLGSFFDDEGLIVVKMHSSTGHITPIVRTGLFQEHPHGDWISFIEENMDPQQQVMILKDLRQSQSGEIKNRLSQLRNGVVLGLSNPVNREVSYVLISLFQSLQDIDPVSLVLGQSLFNLTSVQSFSLETNHKAKQYIDELEVARKIALSINSKHSINNVFKLILESTLEVLPQANNAHIFLHDGKDLIFQNALWADGRKRNPVKNPRKNGLTYTVIKKGEIVRVNDTNTHPLYRDKPYDLDGSIIGVPFNYQGRTVGAMTVAYRKTHAITDDAVRLLGLFADQAAVAIENARIKKILHDQANTDKITKLPNRWALENQFKREIKRATRYQRNLSIIFLDLDNFKQVNDTYGHQVGDLILKNVASLLQPHVREPDFLGRYGGDEFMILLPETAKHQAEALGKRLQMSITAMMNRNCKVADHHLGISFGCATFPRDGETIHTLVRVADNALYGEKG